MTKKYQPLSRYIVAPSIVATMCRHCYLRPLTSAEERDIYDRHYQSLQDRGESVYDTYDDGSDSELIIITHREYTSLEPHHS